MIDTIVLDIEGTTSPASSVRDGLFGHAREHFGRWLVEDRDGTADSVIAGTRQLAGRPDADATEVAEILRSWLDSDVKAELLKTAQGLICAAGFRSGALHGEFFNDVRPALTAWHGMGIALHVFSSGSVRNQQDWFAYARGGDLATLISGWFDLVNAGPKREADSYRKIAGAIGRPAEGILFLSDHADELGGAVAAGWRVLGVARTGEPNPPRPPHRWVNSFAEINPLHP
jgi:enolase-phosphatase E1